MPMQRSILLASTMVLFAGSASAQQMAYSQPSATPQMVVVAQPPQVRSKLGGGFIEYLFGDRPSQPQYAAPPRYAEPQYAAPPQYAPPQYAAAAQPRYIAPPQEYPNEQQAQPVYANPAPQGDPRLEQHRADIRMDPRFLKQEVAYETKEAPGTIVIDTPNHFLYLVEGDGKALRYGVGVGRPGFSWAGVHTVSAKKEWPDWTPPKEMIERQPYLPRHMEGGPNNPLGARAMYLGSTLYRIHGSNEPWTIGHNVSSGCIRLRNSDVIDLYDRVKVGAKVVVM
jgi:lipoprotein-anchoring transpeptidase ErfK/SrfK